MGREELVWKLQKNNIKAMSAKVGDAGGPSKGRKKSKTGVTQQMKAAEKCMGPPARDEVCGGFIIFLC